MSGWRTSGFPTAARDEDLVAPVHAGDDARLATNLVMRLGLPDEREILDMLGLP